LPPVARSLPAETGNDLTTATPGRVPVCHRGADSLGRSRKRPRLRQRPDGCPFADARRPLLAEAGRGRFTRQRPDGRPVTTARATHVGRGRRGPCTQRLPDGARSPLHARPTPAEAGEDLARSDFRTVSPFPLHQLTIGVDRRHDPLGVPTELALAQLRPKPPPRARSHSRHGSEPLISPRSKRLECVAYSPVESHLPSCGHEDA